jgi:hypothetical protein
MPEDRVALGRDSVIKCPALGDLGEVKAIEEDEEDGDEDEDEEPES